MLVFMNCQVVLICKSLKRNRNGDVKKKKKKQFSALLKCPTKHSVLRLAAEKDCTETGKEKKLKVMEKLR